MLVPGRPQSSRVTVLEGLLRIPSVPKGASFPWELGFSCQDGPICRRPVSRLVPDWCRVSPSLSASAEVMRKGKRACAAGGDLMAASASSRVAPLVRGIRLYTSLRPEQTWVVVSSLNPSRSFFHCFSSPLYRTFYPLPPPPFIINSPPSRFFQFSLDFQFYSPPPSPRTLTFLFYQSLHSPIIFTKI